MTKEHSRGIAKLKSLGIKTIKDVDDRKGNVSRFGYIASLIGFDAAVWLMNDLAIEQCCEEIKR